MCLVQPNSETLKPYVTTCLSQCMTVLRTDNEENALVALRIIFDLHKNFRPALEKEVQPFLDFVKTIYQSLPATVEEALNSAATAAGANGVANGAAAAAVVAPGTPVALAGVGAAASGQAAGTTPAKLLRSTGSFKVLTECPLITMLLFQLYPRYFNTNMVALVPLMMNALQLQANAAAATVVRNRFTEFLACQVKTLSFLTYLLRGSFESMKPYEGAIAKCVIRLLKVCPDEAVGTRKEILVATRHILATDFRKAFFPHVDVFLDESTLIGRGRQAHDVSGGCRRVLAFACVCAVAAVVWPCPSCRRRHRQLTVCPRAPSPAQTLRPLAYSTLADLVHHVRQTLTLEQLSKVIHSFSRNIHDPTLPITIQTTSVRLLLNLVDSTFHNDNRDDSLGRQLLARILSTLVNKFGTLQKLIPKVLAAEAEVAAQAHAKAVREFRFCNQMRKIAAAHPAAKNQPAAAPKTPAAAGSAANGGAGAANGAAEASTNGAAAAAPSPAPAPTPTASSASTRPPPSLFLQRARTRSSRSGSYSSMYPRRTLSTAQGIGEPKRVRAVHAAPCSAVAPCAACVALTLLLARRVVDAVAPGCRLDPGCEGAGAHDDPGPAHGGVVCVQLPPPVAAGHVVADRGGAAAAVPVRQVGPALHRGVQ